MAYGLIDAGRQTKQMAMGSTAELAAQEKQREAAGRQIEAQEKSQIASGIGTGAMIGSSFGPVGTVVGGVIGGIAGAIF